MHSSMTRPPPSFGSIGSGLMSGANGGAAAKVIRTRVLLAASGKSLDLEVDASTTIDDLKRKIYTAEELDPQTKRLRLIFAGKLIDNGNSTLADLKVYDGAAIHCAVSDLKQEGYSGDGSSCCSTPLETRILIEPAEGDGRDETHRIIVLPGFRVTPAELAALRAHTMLAVDRESGEGVDEEALRALSDAEREDADPMGTTYDFMWGLVLGIMWWIMIIMLVLSMDRNTALSRRWKLGIFVGVGINLVFILLMFIFEGQMSSP